MRIAINGALGKMGRELERELLQGGRHEIAYLADKNSRLSDFAGECDLVIDFSSREALGDVLGFCEKRKIPLVIGTTGLDGSDREKIMQTAKKIPLLYSENMSLGINLINAFARRLAGELKDAEIEIIETHHDQKKDAPSGTALMLAGEMLLSRGFGEIRQGAREKKSDIPIHSLRLGNEKGTHSIIFSSGAEKIEITHTAGERRLFAIGAIRAAEFLVIRGAGLYSMEEVFSK